MVDTQYTKCYVAFLDVLGFKNRVKEASCQDILDMYNWFEHIHEAFYEGEAEDVVGNVKMKIMSDSICLYIEEDIPNALYYLIMFCVAFQFSLLDAEPCTFVRGGITYGELYAKDDITFGPALTEAYLLEEKNARVPRIIIRKSTLDYGMGKMDEDSKQSINYCIFQDDDAFYVVDCLKLHTIAGFQEVLEKVKKVVSYWLDTTTNESIRQKYLYVKKRIQRYLKEETDA